MSLKLIRKCYTYLQRFDRIWRYFEEEIADGEQKDEQVHFIKGRVNWDCTLRTTISNLEVEYEDIKEWTLQKIPGYEKPVEIDVLTSFSYPLEEKHLGEIVVATTRVETMLGDTAVAVHLDDERCRHLHGKFVIHPYNMRCNGGSEFAGMPRFMALEAITEALKTEDTHH
ncbi:valine--tRNA ligase, mitochondrial 1-like [Humulus lupulus]|uniref:valine--tRNA ligase, mitochondrial 1-like n=1 Tax=Humulus lupulus TaxID=3486 RepID=UPI002B4041C0|nr:valine--tRNA ligase, mitochondrial 1-like [Humulus lupulus]